MKYSIQNIKIPEEKRKEINEKILYLIDRGNINSPISNEDIFNSFTGDGGLHGLSIDNYNSYYEYSEAKKEIEVGQFFTPHQLSKFLVECVKPNNNDLVADLTCGMGNFFNYLPVEDNIYGNEIDIKAYKVARFLYPDANIENKDIRYYNSGVQFDIIFGNPPYNLKWKVGKDEYFSQFYYVLKAAQLLKPGGILALIVPNRFLSDDFIDGNVIKKINEMFNFIIQFDLPSNSFSSVGVESFNTKIMYFQKKSKYLNDYPYTLNKIDVPEINEKASEHIYLNYIKPLLNEKDQLKHKMFFENLNNNRDDDFEYRIKKMLYDIKRNPNINSKHDKALEYINKYYTQEKPEGMNWDEWEKAKITKNKVVSYLKRIIKDQHKKEVDNVKLVKTAYGLKLKAYSHRSKLLLSKKNITKTISFNDMILDNLYPFSDKLYFNLFEKKRVEYLNQNKAFKDITSNKDIEFYLDNFSLYDTTKKESIILNDMQKEDLNKILQKNYSILNWQQGSGKTIAGITWYKYLFEHKNIRNVFVVSAALAINLTWKSKLDDFKEKYITIRSLKDVYNIRPGQVVLISSAMLTKYEKQIKKYIKMQSKKVALIYDESDDLVNHRSNITRSSLNVFRKVQYKLLTTGTTTRNNVNELYSQLELLYNNSINMICEAEYIHRENKKKEIIEEVYNDYYMCPFPAFRGQSLFKSCFSPTKATVFGIRKESQDIYNKESLIRLIEKSIITRKFKEIVGEDKYEIITHRIDQNEAEREVYKKIMQEFYQMSYYFKSTGNYRKDSMLKLIRQIQLLIKSTSIPHMFKEYTASELPNKYYIIFDLINKHGNEKVAIGTVFKPAAYSYYNNIKEKFDRPVFLIDGSINFKKRKEIIKQFEATSNGILISTQQSLKKSVNIPSCNKVIIESMQWNIPKMEQYYFRFIRFDSKDFKEVHFVTYDNTIEQNLLALLMVKERINEFIKTLDFKEQVNIYDEYGIDLDILNNIIEKEIDSDGKIRLTWGSQKVS